MLRLWARRFKANLHTRSWCSWCHVAIQTSTPRGQAPTNYLVQTFLALISAPCRTQGGAAAAGPARRARQTPSCGGRHHCDISGTDRLPPQRHAARRVEQRLLGLPESVEHVIIVSAVPLIFPEIPSALPVARCFNGGCLGGCVGELGLCSSTFGRWPPLSSP